MSRMVDQESRVSLSEQQTLPESWLRSYDIETTPGASVVVAWAVQLYEALVAACDAVDRAAFLERVDARRLAFMLEALLRLYGKRYGKTIRRQRNHIKKLEDHLGAFGYFGDMVEAAQRAGAAEAAVAVLRKKQRQGHKSLNKLLARSWSPNAHGHISGISDLIEAIGAIEWDKPDDDLRFLRNDMARRVRNLHRRKLDMKDLEEGIHELRRQLRWLPLYLTALKGVAELVDDRHPIAEYETLLRDPIAQSPFAILPPPRPKIEPIRISRSLFLANTKLIDVLGTIKDGAQEVQALSAALRSAGLAKSKKKARALAQDELGLDAAEIYGRADAVYHEVHRLGLLPALRSELLEQQRS